MMSADRWRAGASVDRGSRSATVVGACRRDGRGAGGRAPPQKRCRRERVRPRPLRRRVDVGACGRPAA